MGHTQLMCAAERNDDGATAARLTAVLTAFRPGDDALGISELARRTTLPKSTVHRLVGHLVLERWLGRTRRTARGSHLVTALFLAGVGVADLQQVQWVMSAVHYVTGHA